MAGLQHLQLYTYESLVSNIQRTINVTVTQRDLAQPTGHTVEMLYMKFIQVIYALDIDDYLLDLYNEPEPQFADAFVLRIVQRYLRNIMRLTSGTSWIEGKTPVPFDVVRISDITEPNPARTKVILSSLINLVNLRDGETELYNKVVQQLLRLNKQKDTSMQQIEELTKQIEERKAVVEQKRNQLEEEHRKKEERTHDLAETDKARKRVKQELKEIKNEVLAKREKMEAVKAQMMEYETKKLDLQRKLVKSPERVRSEISTKTDEVLEKKAQVQSREEMTRGLQLKLDRLRQIEKDCQTVKGHLDTLLGVLNDKEEQRAQFQSLTDELARHRIAYKEELASKETWEKKREAAEERVANFEIRMENERNELAAKTAEVTLEYERATKERTQADTRIDGESKVAAALEKEIATMIAESELAIKEALGDYWRLMKQADEYITILAKRLQLPLPPA